MTDFINPNEETRIEDGAKVELHFSVAIENGVEIDNTRSREEPVSLVIGDGSLLPGFEKAACALATAAQSACRRKTLLARGMLKMCKNLIQSNLSLRRLLAI